MMDGMSTRKKSDIDMKSGRLTGYVDFGRSQSPFETDNASLAGDALLLIAVGLVAAWKTPIGYFLNNGLTGSILRCSQSIEMPSGEIAAISANTLPYGTGV